MKSRSIGSVLLWIAPLLLAAVHAAPSPASAGASVSATTSGAATGDEATIRRMYENHAKRLRAHDSMNIGLEFAEDAVMIPDVVPDVVGRLNITAWYRKWFDQVEAESAWVEVSFEWDEIRVLGDHALARGAREMITTSRAGRQIRARSKLLEILRRQPDDTWQIVRSMSNNLPRVTDARRNSARPPVPPSRAPRVFPAPGADPAAAEASIRRTLAQRRIWFDARDWEGIRSEFADDVVAILDRTESVAGKEAYAAAFKQEFADYAAAGVIQTMKVAVDEVRVYGDWAHARAIFTVTAAKGERQTTFSRRVLEIFQRQSSGEWKVAYFMNNTLPR